MASRGARSARSRSPPAWLATARWCDWGRGRRRRSSSSAIRCSPSPAWPGWSCSRWVCMPPAETAERAVATGPRLNGAGPRYRWSSARRLERPAPVLSRREALSGWGGGVRSQVTKLLPPSLEQALDALERARGLAAAGSGLIARGMGRAYNDAAQRGGGVVIETTRLRRFTLDPGQGTLTAEAGVTLGELLRALVPRGWMVPVVPGTQHVSVGGAIASDIHGKNHGVAGTFGTHVEALGLLTAKGDVLELDRAGDDGGLLAATIGGMGLTGAVLWARIGLR